MSLSHARHTISRRVPGARCLLAASLAFAGCAPPAVIVTPEASALPAPAPRVRGPYVPTGTAFAARVDAPVETVIGTSSPSFTATVLAPLYSPDGALVVPAGARLYGALATGGTAHAPALRLELDRVETTRGVARLTAAVEFARQDTAAGPRVFIPTAGPDPYSYPYDPFSLGRVSPIGGGPGAGSSVLGGGPWYAPYRAVAVRIPPGSTIRCVLTAPIYPPGSALAP